MFIVFDLDDTLANNAHRHDILKAEHESDEVKWSTFFDACDQDEPVREICNLLSCLVRKHHVEIWTGRSESVRYKTDTWLRKHLPHGSFHYVDALRMRAVDDFRNDTEVKGDWIKEYGRPDLVFDDRNHVCQWWREQGVVCCQVKESDY